VGATRVPAQMPALRLPGRRTGLSYVWLMFLSPLLLVLGGIIILAIGLWRHTDGVAVIGAVSIVAGLLLPRMQGQFEVGPGGIKGAIEVDIFFGVLKRAVDSGMQAEEALELATGAAEQATAAESVGAFAATGERRLLQWPRSAFDRWSYQVHSQAWSDFTRRTLAEEVASTVFAASVSLDRDVAAIVERVAARKRWQVGRNVRRQLPGDPPGRFRIFDFVLQTRKGSIFLETAILRTPEALVGRVHTIADALPEEGVLGAFIVVPDDSISGHPHPEVDIVEVGRLEKTLSEISA
jgi:hypothetical protein